jgi:hypothetical protein
MNYSPARDGCSGSEGEIPGFPEHVCFCLNSGHLLVDGSHRVAVMGPLEGERMGGDRATLVVEDIWCEKIRGCSDSGGGALYSMSAMHR